MISCIFRVASSLDSMVVGEPQILGQVKDAFGCAANAQATGNILNRLLHKAFSVAKRVRSETRIATSAVSISFAAVELAKKIFGELGGKTVMLIGAGEMAELAARHLLSNGIEHIIIANRTYEKAVELAKQFGNNASGDSLTAAEEFGEVVVLAVPWRAAVETVKNLGPLEGKTLIDITNPLIPVVAGGYDPGGAG